MNSFLPVALCRWCLVTILLISTSSAQERSMRFYGNGYSAPDHDRIKIPLTGSVNVTNDFTIECWLKCVASENNGNVSAADHGDGWITGNIFLDRDVYGATESGDFGMAIGETIGSPEGHRVVAFGISRVDSGITIRGNINIADNNWHHIAITRNGLTGNIQLFVDGKLDATGNGPTGSIEYRQGRATSYPNSDPFLVLGAEKHDAGSAYPAYSGFMDELRVSSSIRYLASFTTQRQAFIPDINTAGLYHFNEGNGNILSDDNSTGNTISNGKLNIGGAPVGPAWMVESPFSGNTTIKWLSAQAKKEGQRIIIRWNTNTPPASPDFEIQRSVDGKNFKTIGRLDIGQPCTGTCNYTFTDTHPFTGKNHYRIRSMGANGVASYSGNMSTMFGEKINPYKISQNGNSLVVLNTSTIESLVVWNSEGKRLVEKRNILQGSTLVSLNNCKGFAFVHINLEDGTRFTEKIMLR